MDDLNVFIEDSFDDSRPGNQQPVTGQDSSSSVLMLFCQDNLSAQNKHRAWAVIINGKVNV